MSTTLEALEKILLRDALRKLDPATLAKIDAQLIEFVSKRTVKVDIRDA